MGKHVVPFVPTHRIQDPREGEQPGRKGRACLRVGRAGEIRPILDPQRNTGVEPDGVGVGGVLRQDDDALRLGHICLHCGL